MVKNFTVEERDKLISIINEINEEQWFETTDKIGDFFLGVLEFIGMLDYSDYENDIDTYYKRILDKNDTSIEEIKKIFEDVWNLDCEYKNKVCKHREDYFDALWRYVYILIEIIDGTGGFNPETMKSKLGILNDILEKRVNNPIVNENDYGGYQGSPHSNYEDVEFIVRKYYPKYSDKEIKKLLEKLRNEGCGYVALINTIFAQFDGKEEEFEEIFGFPMYKEDGTLNYDAILVDFYCSEDDSKETGTDAESSKELWERYLKRFGIDVTVDTYVDVTIDNYEKLVQQGQIIVAIWPLRLRDVNGNLVDTREAGHAMTVIGVTEDGKYIVASWGDKYYIDPKDYEGIEGYSHFYFYQTRYD